MVGCTALGFPRRAQARLSCDQLICILSQVQWRHRAQHLMLNASRRTTASASLHSLKRMSVISSATGKQVREDHPVLCETCLFYFTPTHHAAVGLIRSGQPSALPCKFLQEDLTASFCGVPSAGQPALFAEAVADDCDWTQMGAHPLAQRYRSKHAYFEASYCAPL